MINEQSCRSNQDRSEFRSLFSKKRFGFGSGLPGFGTALVALLLCLSSISQSATIQSGKQLRPQASGIVDDDLVFFGGECRVEGAVNGDAALFAETVVSAAEIDGAVLTLGAALTIGGTVEGSLGCLGADILIEGDVNGSTFIMGEQGEVAQEARLQRDCFAFCEKFYFDGSTEGDLVVGGELVVVNGVVEGDLKSYNEHLEIRKNAVINGDIIVNPGVTPTIDEGALILGEVITRRERVSALPSFDLSFLMIWIELYFISSIFIIGLLVVFISGRRFQVAAQTLHRQPARSAALAILTIVIGSALCGVLAITLMGIPASLLLGGGLILFVLLFGQVYTAAGIGSLILGDRKSSENFGFLAWAARLIVGLLILAAVLQIPVVGWPLYLLSGVYGIGGFVSSTMLCRTISAVPATPESQPESPTPSSIS